MIDTLLDECAEHLQNGRLEDAATAANKACDLALKGLPPEDPRIGQALRTAAVLETQLGHHERARTLLSTLEKRFLPDDPRRAIALSDLANLELSVGDRAAAEAALRSAVDLIDAHEAELGVAVTPLLGMLASIAAVGGDTKDARRLTARVLDILITEEGETSENVADTLTFSALLDLSAGDVSGARALAAKAVEIYENGEGPEGRSAVARAIVDDPEGIDADQVLASGLPPLVTRS